MNEQFYKDEIVPIIVMNFNLKNPNESYSEILTFTTYWSDVIKNDTRKFCGLYSSLIYLN